MIIRILGEGQFLLDDRYLEKINAIDNQIVSHVSANNRAEFSRDLTKLILAVKELSKPLDPSQIVPSDIIIPPSDLSFEEARQIFCGDGLIKG